MTADVIRDAATMILVRDGQDGPSILMGQRGAKAAFMPMKFVFPGGAVDKGDADIPLGDPLAPDVAQQLLIQNTGPTPDAIAVAAIRELWEEAGLILGTKGEWPKAPPEDWVDFAKTGYRPAASALKFIFRAITPPGRTRRFDARFFLANANAIAGDPTDFSFAQDELAHLQWVPLHKARELDLPFITEVVLAEVSAHLNDDARPGVPFFDNFGSSHFRRL